MKNVFLVGMLLCGLSDLWGAFTVGGGALSTDNVTLDGTVATIAGNVVVSGGAIFARSLLGEIQGLSLEMGNAATVRIEGSLTIISSDVTSANLDEITAITGDVEIYGNTNLVSLSMAGLVTLGGNLWIGGYSEGDIDPNTAMTTCTLTALETVGGYF